MSNVERPAVVSTTVLHVAQTLQFYVPVDADADTLEQELVGRGRRLLHDNRLSGHSLDVYTDGSVTDRELVRQLVAAELTRQWVPGDVRFADETGTQD